MTEAFVCEAVRTAIGRVGGKLAYTRADDLAAMAIRGLVEQLPDLDPAMIDEVILGCANQAGEDNRNVARMALLLSGLPPIVPGATINRLCASGLDAVGMAARAIQTGQIKLAIAGGVESMTRAPFVMAKPVRAFQRSAALEDTMIGWRLINPQMRTEYGVDTMPETAENVAEAYQVARADQDAFAFASQQRASRAQASGYFADEIVPVSVQDIRGNLATFDTDEHLRPATTLEGLAALDAPFRAGGSVTAGNSSGINDGAAAMFIASEPAAKAHGLSPRARILGMATAGVPPRLMGIGPVPATKKLLAQLGLSTKDFDHIEINEAFAAQAIASLRELAIEPIDARVNPHGGAIALGHPLGMSGSRLVQTAVHNLGLTGGKRALITLCVGVGQGVAMALERI